MALLLLDLQQRCIFPRLRIFDLVHSNTRSSQITDVNDSLFQCTYTSQHEHATATPKHDRSSSQSKYTTLPPLSISVAWSIAWLDRRTLGIYQLFIPSMPLLCFSGSREPICYCLDCSWVAPAFSNLYTLNVKQYLEWYLTYQDVPR